MNAPTQEQLDILSHTDRHASRGVYCGDSPAMQACVERGWMEFAFRKSYVPDPYYRITEAGREVLKATRQSIKPTRINLAMSGQDIVAVMCDGNPGALQCLCELIRDNANIDPESALGSLSAIAMLDKLKIYGTSIYVLWNDQCDRSTRSLVMLMRAVQLGLIDKQTVQNVAADQTRSQRLDLAALDALVCDRLEEFQRPPATDAA